MTAFLSNDFLFLGSRVEMHDMWMYGFMYIYIYIYVYIHIYIYNMILSVLPVTLGKKAS